MGAASRHRRRSSWTRGAPNSPAERPINGRRRRSLHGTEPERFQHRIGRKGDARRFPGSRGKDARERNPFPVHYDLYSAGTARLFAGLVSCLDMRSTGPPPTSGRNAASSASATSFA